MRKWKVIGVIIAICIVIIYLNRGSNLSKYLGQDVMGVSNVKEGEVSFSYDYIYPKTVFIKAEINETDFITLMDSLKVLKRSKMKSYTGNAHYWYFWKLGSEDIGMNNEAKRDIKWWNPKTDTADYAAYYNYNSTIKTSKDQLGSLGRIAFYHDKGYMYISIDMNAK